MMHMSAALTPDSHRMANYFYSPSPTIAPTKINQMDAIDALDKQNGVLLGLENRIQTKRKDSGGNLNSVDLATLLISSTYNFKGTSVTEGDGKFSTIDFKLELIPYEWAYLQGTMSVDPKHSWVQQESIDLVTHWKDKWSLAISDRYEHTDITDTSLISLDGTYQINEKWKIRAYERYNASGGSFEEQEYTLTRDLHCWLAELTYDIGDTGNTGLWLIFKLKAFPQTPIGLKQTYSRPRFGEAGS